MHRSRDRLLFRDAIIALDGRCAGASHRDTAEVIFGIKRVREDWSARGGWLKEPMRRALAKCAATAAIRELWMGRVISVADNTTCLPAPLFLPAPRT